MWYCHQLRLLTGVNNSNLSAILSITRKVCSSNPNMLPASHYLPLSARFPFLFAFLILDSIGFLTCFCYLRQQLITLNSWDIRTKYESRSEFYIGMISPAWFSDLVTRQAIMILRNSWHDQALGFPKANNLCLRLRPKGDQVLAQNQDKPGPWLFRLVFGADHENSLTPEQAIKQRHKAQGERHKVWGENIGIPFDVPCGGKYSVNGKTFEARSL
jgi:hypothetical protein